MWRAIFAGLCYVYSRGPAFARLHERERLYLTSFPSLTWTGRSTLDLFHPELAELQICFACSMLDPPSTIKFNIHCNPREMEWKTQNPTFQVLYSVIPRDDRPPPLQIRSFTSASYEAIKRRERKKSGRREQRSCAWKKEDVGASADAIAIREAMPVDSGPYNVVSATHWKDSGTGPLDGRDGGRPLVDDDLQHRLSSPSEVFISRHEQASSGEMQSPATQAPPTMSPQVRVLDLEAWMDAEQAWEICGDRVLDPGAASPDNVHMITADGGTFDQQPHIQTHTDSGVGGRPRPDEQLIESRKVRPTSPVSLEPSSVPVVATVTDLGSLSSTYVADVALAEAVPAEPTHATGVPGSVGLLTCVARLGQASGKDRIPPPINSWTSEQDEQLLHVRDTAQLKWKNVVSYFPGMTLDAVKDRYKHLNRSRVTCKIVGAKAKTRVQMRQRTTYHTLSTVQRAAKRRRASSQSKSCKQSVSITPERHATPHFGRVTEQAKPIEHVASLAVAPHEIECQRTSRCGRPIRHPFRHRLSEGYV